MKKIKNMKTLFNRMKKESKIFTGKSFFHESYFIPIIWFFGSLISFLSYLITKEIFPIYVFIAFGSMMSILFIIKPFCDWYYFYKPITDQLHKEVMLEIKYPFMYNKFIEIEQVKIKPIKPPSSPSPKILNEGKLSD